MAKGGVSVLLSVGGREERLAGHWGRGKPLAWWVWAGLLSTLGIPVLAEEPQESARSPFPWSFTSTSFRVLSMILWRFPSHKKESKERKRDKKKKHKKEKKERKVQSLYLHVIRSLPGFPDALLENRMKLTALPEFLLTWGWRESGKNVDSFHPKELSAFQKQEGRSSVPCVSERGNSNLK